MEPCPKAKQGVNAWIHKRVFGLIVQGQNDEQIRITLGRDTRDCGRPTEQDINHSIETTRPYVENLKASGSKLLHRPNGGIRRPSFDPIQRLEAARRIRQRKLYGIQDLTGSKCVTSINAIIRKYPGFGIHSWKRRGEVNPITALKNVFQNENRLVGAGYAKDRFLTTELKHVVSNLTTFQYVVPTPMLAKIGLTNEGKVSKKCDGNVGQPWHLVVDFDEGELDEQARILRHLNGSRPLVMVVYSGNKSLHGWFNAYHWSDKQNKRFFRYACQLGADPRMWVPSQFARMPGGINRTTQKTQEVLYFEPAY